MVIKIWDRLEKKFKEWEIRHTGGGMFAVAKDFKDKSHRDVMVLISEFVVVVIKEIKGTRYIDLEKFLNNQDIYWETAGEFEEVLIEKNNGNISVKSLAKEIFEHETIQDILKQYNKFLKIIWEEE